MQLGVVLAAPQIAFPFLANLFTVFAFGMIWLPLRNSVTVWALGIAGTAIVFFAVKGYIGIPSSSTFELALVWLYFSLILGRCLLLSVSANEMRARLADSRRKLAASLDQVQRLASEDELTGILNRRSLIAALERERSRAERSGVPFSIAMIDLDHFKQVNDAHGHTAGDEVLRALATTVHDTMRVTDVFGRWGGEEFLMILVGDAPELALKVMERIRSAIAAKTGPRSRRSYRSLCRPASLATARAKRSNNCCTAQTLRCTRQKTRAAIPSSSITRHKQYNFLKVVC